MCSYLQHTWLDLPALHDLQWAAAGIAGRVAIHFEILFGVVSGSILMDFQASHGASGLQIEWVVAMMHGTSRASESGTGMQTAPVKSC